MLHKNLLQDGFLPSFKQLPMFTLRMWAHAPQQEIFSSDTRDISTTISCLLRTSCMGCKNAGSWPLFCLKLCTADCFSWISFARKSKGSIHFDLRFLLSFVTFLHHKLLAGQLSFKLCTSQGRHSFIYATGHVFVVWGRNISQEMYNLLTDAQNPTREAGNGSAVCQADPSSQHCIVKLQTFLVHLFF